MELKLLDEELYDEEGDDFIAKHPGDAGIDLRLREFVGLLQGETKKVPLGVAVRLPRGTVGWITSRSSAALRGFLVHEGKIDEGYRGEVHAVVTNTTQKYLHMERGEKICQLLVVPIHEPNWALVDDLDETSRGADGFGSTT